MIKFYKFRIQNYKPAAATSPKLNLEVTVVFVSWTRVLDRRRHRRRHHSVRNEVVLNRPQQLEAGGRKNHWLSVRMTSLPL